MDEAIIKKVTETAGSLHDKGFNCAESIFLTFRNYAAPFLTEDMVRIATPFGGGIGRSGCICGALSGAIIILGAARGRISTEAPKNESYNLSGEYHRIFKEKFGSTCCRVLVKSEFGSEEQGRRCFQIISESAGLFMKFLLEKEIVPDIRKKSGEDNKKLENSLQKTINELRHRDDMLTILSRQASMGEMIGFISHQWKQNIYAISLYTEALKNILDQKGCLTVETAKDPLNKIDSFIIEMYDTLNDFTDFVRPEKEIEFFSISEAVDETLSLMHDVITINSVEILKEYKNEPALSGFSNELKQVVINIIKNSIDAFNENRIKERIIVIKIESNEKMYYLSVKDNAGGITLENPDIIFEKFFTMKNSGTGLGLYLSRMIIEERFNGKIEVHNTGGGAVFNISIPVITEDTVF